MLYYTKKKNQLSNIFKIYFLNTSKKTIDSYFLIDIQTSL